MKKKLILIIIIVSFIPLSCVGVFSSLSKNDPDESLDNAAMYSMEEIHRIISNETGVSLKPLTKNNTYYFENADLNGDGLSEIISCFVETADNGTARFEYLSNVKHLYSAEHMAQRIYVFVFSPEGSSLVLKKKIDLGKKVLIKDMAAIVEPPGIIKLYFQSQKNKEFIFIAFDSELNESVLAFNDGRSSFIKLKDMNLNGVVDIINFETGFEDGVGEELFATWYKWNGNQYQETESIALIRALNNFLVQSKDLLLSGNYSGFMNYSLNNTETANPVAVVNKVFESENGNEFISGNNILDIVFPEVHENPFDLEHGSDYFFELLVKQVTNKDNRFFKCRIVLDDNPFSGKVFYFSLD